jgi:hypothetical protein
MPAGPANSSACDNSNVPVVRPTRMVMLQAGGSATSPRGRLVQKFTSRFGENAPLPVDTGTVPSRRADACAFR